MGSTFAAHYLFFMREKLTALALKPQTLLIVFLLAAIGASVQNILLGTHPFIMPGPGTFPEDIMNKPELMIQFQGKFLTEYNNYKIFKQSYFNLLQGNNLYGLYPDFHWDFYKYSPTFALFMGAMAYLPDVLGLSIWNILNAVTVFLAIRMLPLTTRTQCLLLWFVSQELLTCLQNNQSNGLMAGLMIAAWACMHRGKAVWATLWIVLAAYIKVYSVIAFCMVLFYPDRGRFILWAIIWTVLLGALPLLVTSPQTLIWQYQNWKDLIAADAVAATGMSVAGWLETWFGITNVKSAVSLIGILLFLLQLVRYKVYANDVYRLLIIASLLVWVVIFNHKAESPTFVIAVAGVGIWYYIQPRATWRLVVLLLVLFFTCFGTTDLFPPYVRQHFIYPYTIKVVPCIIAWCAIFIDIFRLKPGDTGRMLPASLGQG
jgi:hypothetical protein